MTSVFVGATYYDYTENLEYVALPFPDPKTLGDNVFAVVFWDGVNKRYEYWAFSPFLEGEKDYQCIFNTNDCRFYIQASEGFLHMTSYRMWFYPESSSYNISCYQISETSGYFNYSGPSGVSCDVTRLVAYGDVILHGPNPINSQVAYTFNNDISPFVFKQMSSDLGEIKLYCADILEALGEGSDYVPPESTTNDVIDGYHQAEQDLMNNQFDNIDSVVDVLPTFNADVVNGTSTGNSFLFVSDLMNFLTGNGSGYGTSINSMGKIASSVYIILSLGFASFIIGLVNRRKE